MGTHPINLGLRFILELIALFALGYWGWTQGDGVVGIGLAIALPLIGAVIWGTFAVPDDPSRSGNAPIAVTGWIRLVLEITFFVLATVALLDRGIILPAILFISVVIIHYIVSYDRIKWLLQQ